MSIQTDVSPAVPIPPHSKAAHNVAMQPPVPPAMAWTSVQPGAHVPSAPLAPWEMQSPLNFQHMGMRAIAPTAVDKIKTEPVDLEQFNNLPPIGAELQIETLPADVEQDLRDQTRKRRVPEVPMDPNMPVTKRRKLERMQKNRESAQRSREKKARHRALLEQQVRLLSAKNNELTKCLSLLTSQCQETQSLREQNLKLQQELYELKLKNTRLNMEKMLQDQRMKEQTSNKEHPSATRQSRTSSIDTTVTETSTSTDSAVGEEASHGGRVGDSNGVDSDHNPRESPDATNTGLKIGSGRVRVKAPNHGTSVPHEFVQGQTQPGLGFQEMAGSLENQLALFNDIVENKPWEVPGDAFPGLQLGFNSSVRSLRSHTAVFKVESPCTPKVQLSQVNEQLCPDE